MQILVEMIDLVKQLKAERDISASFFPTIGSSRTIFENVRGDVRGDESGARFLCTFPVLTRRFLDEQKQGWFESLFVQAIIS